MATSVDGILRGSRRVCNIPIRVLIRESHNLSQKVTQYGTEGRKTISDHVISNPNSVDIEFEMTNTNMGREAAKQTFLEFVKLMEKNEPVNLFTEHASYKNMVCESFNVDHSAPNRGAYRATARMKQAGIIGEKGTVYEARAQGGREEAVLAGKPMYVGRSDSPPVNRECTYRTAVYKLDAGITPPDNNPALDAKILKRLEQYAAGVFK